MRLDRDAVVTGIGAVALAVLSSSLAVFAGWAAYSIGRLVMTCGGAC